MMQADRIRAFKRTWKPRDSSPGRYASRPAPVAKVSDFDFSPYPQVSRDNPLPPPAPAALRAVWSGPHRTTGIRRKPILDAERPSIADVPEARALGPTHGAEAHGSDGRGSRHAMEIPAARAEPVKATASVRPWQFVRDGLRWLARAVHGWLRTTG